MGEQDVDQPGRSRARTRGQLVETSIDVFARCGIDGASVADLCAAAGYSRGAFYSNFNSKEELALAAQDVQLDRLIRLIDDTVEDGLSRGVGTPALLDSILGAAPVLTDDVAWRAFRMEIDLAALRDPAFRGPARAARIRLRDAVARNLQRIVDRDGRRFTLPVVSVAALLIATYEGLANGEFTGTTDRPLEEFGRILLRVIWAEPLVTRDR